MDMFKVKAICRNILAHKNYYESYTGSKQTNVVVSMDFIEAVAKYIKETDKKYDNVSKTQTTGNMYSVRTSKSGK